MSWKLHSSNLVWNVSCPVTYWVAVFVPCGLLNEFLNNFSYPCLEGPVIFLPGDPRAGAISSHQVPGIKNDRSWRFSKYATAYEIALKHN